MITLPLLVALATMAAEPSVVAAPQRSEVAAVLLGNKVSVGAGAYSTGYTFRGGAWSDAFATQHVDARWRFGGFTLEGGVLHALPIATSAAQSFTGHLRLGWTFSRATVTAGLMAQLAPAAKPSAQLLPTVSAAYAFDRFGVSAGLFDVHGLSIARVSFEHEHFGIGYVAPLGIEAHGRLRITPTLQLQVQALAFRAFNAQVGYLGISGVFDADAIRAGGDV